MERQSSSGNRLPVLVGTWLTCSIRLIMAVGTQLHGFCNPLDVTGSIINIPGNTVAASSVLTKSPAVSMIQIIPW
jgi:hypothetical protein